MTKKRPIVIVFLGMDGSGKTTLSKYLYEELKKMKLEVKYLWWLEGENSILKKIIKKFRKVHKFNPQTEKNLNIQPKKRDITTKLFYFIYPKIVFLNYLLFGFVKVWIPKIVGAFDVIVLDRYICDVVFAVSTEFNYPYYRMTKLLKVFSELLPKPDMIFVIEVLPKIAYLRKKDEIHSVENAKKLWENYNTLYKIVSKIYFKSSIVYINNSMNIEIAKARIMKNTLNVLGDA